VRLRVIESVNGPEGIAAALRVDAECSTSSGSKDAIGRRVELA
jgi:hypothetical protein